MAGNCSSVTEYLLIIYRAFGLIHRTIKQNTTTTKPLPPKKKTKTHFIDHMQMGQIQNCQKISAF